jgi:hypothetical protein
VATGAVTSPTVTTGPVAARSVPSGTAVSPAAPWPSGASAGRRGGQKRHHDDRRDASHAIHNRQTIRWSQDYSGSLLNPRTSRRKEKKPTGMPALRGERTEGRNILRPYKWKKRRERRDESRPHKTRRQVRRKARAALSRRTPN